MYLTGIGTKIDPTLCRADRLVGQVLGAVGTLPEIFIELEISYFLLRRLLGVRTEGDKKGAKVCVLEILLATKTTSCVGSVERVFLFINRAVILKVLIIYLNSALYNWSSGLLSARVKWFYLQYIDAW